MPDLNLSDQAKRGAVKAALDQVEKEKRAQIAWEVTSDQSAEVSLQGEKGRLSGAVYAKALWGLTKDYVAGVRGAWSFTKK